MPRPQEMPDIAGVIIPDSALPILSKLAEDGDVTLAIDEHKLSASAGDAKFVTKLVDGNFVDYRRVVPEQSPERSALIDRGGLLAALKRLDAVAEGDSAVNLGVSQDGLKVSGRLSQFGEGVEDVEAEVPGDALSVGISRRWLGPALSAFSGEHVLLEQGARGEAVRLTSSAETDAGLTVIVMPVIG